MLYLLLLLLLYLLLLLLLELVLPGSYLLHGLQDAGSAGPGQLQAPGT